MMTSVAGIEPKRSLLVVVPTYNDWEALMLLVESFDQVLTDFDWTVRVVIVDDGSDSEPPLAQLRQSRNCVAEIQILTLRRNLGHQRAIAIALAWVDANATCDAVLVMDGDGEDSPLDIRRLAECYIHAGENRIVFAARHRRSEGMVFQAFYHFYRAIHWLLTGIGVRVGNFSLIPRGQLHRLVVVSDLWNHYAAAVFKARLPTVLLPTSRATRLSGRPKMNFTQLVVHGLSAISVFGDRVGVRLLIAASLLSVGTVLSVTVVMLSGTFPNGSSPSKLIMAAAGTTVLVLNLLVAVALFAFGVLGSRDTAGFLPARDYTWFISDISTLWSRDE